MLTDKQKIEASRLAAIRPPVVPGTRYIPNDSERESFYAMVNDAMKGIKDFRDVQTFCDIAGVPD